jgi:uncharacterized ferritin-like protein (DUF455 family)
MELRDFAIHILSADTLEEKLFTPEILTDEIPGPTIIWKEPSRPSHLSFQKYNRKQRLPSLHELKHPDKRALCLHRFAGHELLAVEIMAYALLAFPEAPKTFRKGVAHTLKEEQEHVRLYLAEMSRFNMKLGDVPLFRNFWSFVPHLNTPSKYISLMSLTFEMANLDFAPIYGSAFAEHGDLESATLMKRILHDEIKHVSFGCRWIKSLNPTSSPWDAWIRDLPPRMTPARAKGPTFHEDHRLKASVPSDWIENLKQF